MSDTVLDPNYSGVLPAAGAFTDQAYEKLPQPNPRRLSVAVKYTAAVAAVNGQAKFKFQWQIAGTPGFFETLIDSSSPTVAQPNATVPEYELVVKSPVYTPAGTVGLFRLISLEVPSAATAFRVLAAEVGDTVHPGTVEIQCASSDVI
jgi:hypothetical protein